MPYYCTVPRCTSMAGKVKNVSFHQFPRDEELAKLWNKILKRGKPYTKYSKVCSLHFKSEDYTITNAKNKEIPGQWRTLRKDAIPSQNLPGESPTRSGRPSEATWTSSPSILEPQIQTIAQAIYIQTMMTLQAGGTMLDLNTLSNDLQDASHLSHDRLPPPHESSETEEESVPIELTNKQDRVQILHEKETTSYKCTECLKCFKDPDVLTLHKRAHAKDKTIDNENAREKENVDRNSGASQKTLKANPILANLLKSSSPQHTSTFNNSSTLENQIMSNMAAYVCNLSSLLSKQNGGSTIDNDSNSDCDSEDLNLTNSNSLVVDEDV